jgi:hypothetical protein
MHSKSHSYAVESWYAKESKLLSPMRIVLSPFHLRAVCLPSLEGALLLLSLDRDREYEGRVGEWESDLEKGGGMLALRQQIVSTAQLVRTAKQTYSPLFCVRQLLFVHVYGFCVGFLYCCHDSHSSQDLLADY